MAEKQTTKADIFKALSAVDVKPYIQKKNGFSYLSWATAWKLLAKQFPNSSYKFTKYDEIIKGQKTGRKVDYLLNAEGCTVECTLTIEGQEYPPMWLYCMDNRSHAAHTPDIAVINKTKLRCLVKAIAVAGLGIDVYGGEDLPDEIQQPKPNPAQQLLAEFNAKLSETAQLLKTSTNQLNAQIKQQFGSQKMSPEKKLRTAIAYLIQLQKQGQQPTQQPKQQAQQAQTQQPTPQVDDNPQDPKTVKMFIQNLADRHGMGYAEARELVLAELGEEITANNQAAAVEAAKKVSASLNNGGQLQFEEAK